MISKQEYVKLNGKSRTVSLILTIFFGPIGLIYSSWKGAVAMILVLVGLSVSTAGIGGVIGAFIAWLVSIPVGDHCAEKANMKAEAEYRIRTVR